MKKKPKRLRNISKMNYKRNKGYWVRFIRSIDGTPTTVAQKYFSYSEYGSWKNAEERAIQYRDITESLLNNSQKPRLRIKPHKNNKSKKLGVCRVRCTKVYDGVSHDYFYWEAYGNIEESHQFVGRFSENIYGKRNAKKLAMSLRDWIETKIKN